MVDSTPQEATDFEFTDSDENADSPMGDASSLSDSGKK